MSEPTEKVEKKEGASAVEHINLKVVGSVSIFSKKEKEKKKCTLRANLS